MKILLLLMVGALGLFAGACASQAPKAGGESRLSGRMGVGVSSQDASRIVPMHRELQPPAN